MSDDPYFQTMFADRIGGEAYGKSTDIYKFEKIKRAKRDAVRDFPDRPLLDFGIGENDAMAAPSVRDALKVEVDDPANRGYADNGIQAYKDAAAEWMARELGVSVDPVTEVNHCIGSKSALALLPAAFINPGDITLMTTPGYPVAGTHTRYYGGTVYHLPLVAENSFLPDLDAVPTEVCRKAKLLVLNFPNSPTGTLADEAFYRKVVDFARTHQIVVIQDAAHIMLTYGRRPLSFLSIEGAKDVGVEVHSMSKGFDMIGWRLGFVAGHPRIVRAFADVKDNSDSGQFIAIQKAAIKALSDPDITVRNRTKYERRLEKLVAALREVGFEARMPGGTYFLYVRAPRGVQGGPTFENGESASQFLIRQRSICTVPWDEAGAYLRFSVTYLAPTEADEDRMMEALRQRLADVTFVW
jgi:LL-diaminopimelate aminotransferase